MCTWVIRPFFLFLREGNTVRNEDGFHQLNVEEGTRRNARRCCCRSMKAKNTGSSPVHGGSN